MREISLIAILCCFISVTIIRANDEQEVVVRIVGGAHVAKMISDEMGYLYKGPVS